MLRQIDFTSIKNDDFDSYVISTLHVNFADHARYTLKTNLVRIYPQYQDEFIIAKRNTDVYFYTKNKSAGEERNPDLTSETIDIILRQIVGIDSSYKIEKSDTIIAIPPVNADSINRNSHFDYTDCLIYKDSKDYNDNEDPNCERFLIKTNEENRKELTRNVEFLKNYFKKGKRFGYFLDIQAYDDNVSGAVYIFQRGKNIFIFLRKINNSDSTFESILRKLVNFEVEIKTVENIKNPTTTPSRDTLTHLPQSSENHRSDTEEEIPPFSYPTANALTLSLTEQRFLSSLFSGDDDLTDPVVLKLANDLERECSEETEQERSSKHKLTQSEIEQLANDLERECSEEMEQKHSSKRRRLEHPNFFSSLQDNADARPSSASSDSLNQIPINQNFK